MQKIFSIKIAGQAGQGIKTSGLSFAKYANRMGKYILNYIEYPSLIRGGHNVMQINISDEPVLGPSVKTDLLIALNQESIDLHLHELTSGAGIIFDGEKKYDLSKVPANINICPVPLSAFAKKAGGDEILTNTVSLGSAVAHLGGSIEGLKELLADEFGGKSKDVLEANFVAAELGYSFSKETYPEYFVDVLSPLKVNKDKPNIVINGNESAALGAIAGGLQFSAIYPMSPISNILHVLAKYQETYGYVYKQPEDEISAINMTLGAAHAGARSLTATSGGGFALMAESYGLAGIAEIPIVIIEGQRGGPATGLPTWSEQGDLRFVLHAHQSDFPRIILTPGDPEETFYMTAKALNLAEKYQTPVVVLIDKNICENDQTTPFFDMSSYKVDRGKLTFDYVEDFKRYQDSEDGVSPRSVPGSGNFFITTSDEHDVYGISNEEIPNRNIQMNKRMRKLETCAKHDMPDPTVYGPKDADVSFISWGSNKGAILQAIKEFPNANFMHLNWINPFPTAQVKNFINSSKHVVLVECNYSAQLGGIIAEKTGLNIEDKFLKYDGRPFFVEELIGKINSVLKGTDL